jgi:hypothetical protein
LPTTVTKTVKAAGGDYGSLAAWEAAENGGLVAADEIRRVLCYALGSMDGACTIAGGTTDTTRYLIVEAAENHGGVWTSSAYQIGLSASAGTVLNITQGWTQVKGIQVQVSSVGGFGGIGILNSQTTFQWNFIDRCIVRLDAPVIDSGGSNCYGIAEDFGGTRVTNCTIYGFEQTVSLGRGLVTNGSLLNPIWYNNTIYGCDVCYSGAGSSPPLLINNIAQNNTGSACYVGSFHASSACNISDDGTQPGGKSANVNFVSTTFATADFHLSLTDTAANSYGTDLSADGNYAFSNDIDGATRSAPWSAGSDQRAASLTATFRDIYEPTYYRKGWFDPTAHVQGWLDRDFAPFLSTTATPSAAVSTWVANNPTATAGAISATPSPATATWTAPTPTVALALSTTTNVASSTWTANDPATTPGATTSTPSPSISTWTAPTPTGANALTLATTPGISTWTANDPSVTTALSLTTSPASWTWVANAPDVATSLTLATTPAISTWTANAPSVATDLSLSSSPAVSSWVANAPTVALSLDLTTSPATSAWTSNDPTAAAGAVSVTTTAAVSTWTSNDPSISTALTETTSPAVSTWTANDVTLNVVTGVTNDPAISTWVANAPSVTIGLTSTPAVSSWVANDPTASALGVVGATVGQLFPTGF